VKLSNVTFTLVSGAYFGFGNFEVIYNLNELLYGRRVSPNLITSYPLLKKVNLDNTGSRAGSSSSPTLSINTVLPKRIAFSNVRKNVSSVNLTTSKFLLSFFLIHLLAYPYGSIIKGHLLALVIINPFSIERLSVGSPYKFHYLTVT
jgi:hypothetical protein